MRIIKFRGKRELNDVWAYGEPHVHTALSPHVYTIINEIVKPDTIGQFTGLYDKNGTEIYDGDILQFTSVLFRKKYIYQVKMLDDTSILTLEKKGFNPEFDGYQAFPYNWFNNRKNRIEVIGNVYDNPELLNE